jgi:hypothetical protein
VETISFTKDPELKAWLRVEVELINKISPDSLHAALPLQGEDKDVLKTTEVWWDDVVTRTLRNVFGFTETAPILVTVITDPGNETLSIDDLRIEAILFISPDGNGLGILDNWIEDSKLILTIESVVGWWVGRAESFAAGLIDGVFDASTGLGFGVLYIQLPEAGLVVGFEVNTVKGLLFGICVVGSREGRENGFALGSPDGLSVCITVGAVGMAIGRSRGFAVGFVVVLVVGLEVGLAAGFEVDSAVGLVEGLEVESAVGFDVDLAGSFDVGLAVEWNVCIADGFVVGSNVGSDDGSLVDIAIGLADGFFVGWNVGREDGLMGMAIGRSRGFAVGFVVVLVVGLEVGLAAGFEVDSAVGLVEGLEVEWAVGFDVDLAGSFDVVLAVGLAVEWNVCSADGFVVGSNVGRDDGSLVDIAIGLADGFFVGWNVGREDGSVVCISIGSATGRCVL